MRGERVGIFVVLGASPAPINRDERVAVIDYIVELEGLVQQR